MGPFRNHTEEPRPTAPRFRQKLDPHPSSQTDISDTRFRFCTTWTHSLGVAGPRKSRFSLAVAAVAAAWESIVLSSVRLVAAVKRPCANWLALYFFLPQTRRLQKNDVSTFPVWPRSYRNMTESQMMNKLQHGKFFKLPSPGHFSLHFVPISITFFFIYLVFFGIYISWQLFEAGGLNLKKFN